MTRITKGMHGIWGSRLTFILAATGSAVGLGNIWKFPYITGENGGAAFVLIYLACIFAIGIPIMMGEVMLGRKMRLSPIHTMRQVTMDQEAPGFFKSVGWMGALAGFLILSFYSVIAGWTLVYTGKMASGVFVGADASLASETFSNLLASPTLLLGLHTAFMVMTAVVIARGVKQGLENAVRILMPLLFVMLILLLGYGLTTPGFVDGLSFLFSADFSKLTTDSIVVALGHAFFTLSLGMGAIMAYGAYMPDHASLGKTVIIVAILDTVVALVAGLVIFAVVFSNGMEPGAGPGLMFQTLPLAFSSLPYGSIIGTLFFALVVVAAWSSAISLAEPAVAWAVESGLSRVLATSIICGLAWLLGIATVFSFNEWADYQFFVTASSTLGSEWYFFTDVSLLPAALADSLGSDITITGKTFFDALDYVTANIMLPVGGVLIAIFVGWFMSYSTVAKDAKVKSLLLFNLWRFMIRIVAPLAVLYVFINGLF